LARAASRPENIEQGFEFYSHDVVANQVDGTAFDVVMLRDVLQHMSVVNGARAIGNVRDGGVKYLIVTTLPFAPNNTIRKDQQHGEVTAASVVTGPDLYSH
jgi:hypothetical protein